MQRHRRLLALLLVLGVINALWIPAQAQTQPERYFPETGHWISGEFLDFYLAAADPLLVYGYPITDAFQDPLSGFTVQYFNRARFELHIEATRGQRVQLSPLGWLLYEPGPEAEFSTDTPACRYFPEKGMYVCYAFLDFFNANGGIAQLGAPISNIENHDGLYIQYFERARLEWHPELASGQRVTISALGRVYFDQRIGDPTLLAPNISNSITQSVIQLQVRAFVANAVVAPKSRQTVYVVVQDQYLRAVTRANAAVTIRFPGGKEERHSLPLTDEYGITQLEFNVGDQPVDNIVELTVEVSKGGLQKFSSTWFRIWW